MSEKHCPNCGEFVTENYCSGCGQKKTDLNLPVKQLVTEFLGDAFSFDSRFFRTFKPLLFKPGLLTKKFNAGKRVSYMSPLRLYLFISLIFFFILALADVELVKVSSSPKGDSEMSSEQTPTGETPSQDEPEPGTQVPTSFLKQIKQTFFKKMEKAGQNQALLNTTVVNRLPQLMFFLVPFFALFLKLLYLRRDRLYIHHLVFALHFHSFTFLILTAMVLIYLLTNQPFGLALIPVLPVYLFISMKRVYNQSAVMTLIKMLILNAIYLVLVIISMLVVIAITILLYD